MFAKLLKYDMKSTMRIGLPLIIAGVVLTVLGVLNGISSALVSEVIKQASIDPPEWLISNDPLYAIFTIATLLLSVLLSFFDVIVVLILSALIIAMVVVNLVNFYKSLITDEGYLAFTLPVKPVQILTSKLLNASVWNIAVGALSLGGALITRIPNFVYQIASLFKMYNELDMEFSLWDAIKSVIGLDGISPINIVLLLFLVVVFYLLLIIALQTFMFFTVFLGGVVAKRRKFLASAGFTVAGYYTYYMLEQILSFIIIVGCLVPLFFVDNLGGIVAANYMLLILNIILFLSSFALVFVIALFFFLTNLLMTKKLNLP